MRAAPFASLIAGLALTFLPGLAAARTPVIVELFTAQGCSSCGEANASIAKLADRPDVLPLTFSVDYWDYLGWTDTFAKPEFALRQKAYVARLALREPYTPQVVVDGRAQAGGLQTEKVDKLIEQAAASHGRAPDIAFITAHRVDVGAGVAPRGGADVWLVRYDPREQDVAIRKGDNRGQTVPHLNVVREITRLGAWKGRPTAYRLPPPPEDGLVTLILVQGSKGGRIMAAGRPKTPAAKSPS